MPARPRVQLPSAEPKVSHYDARGDEDEPFGFVYFSEGSENYDGLEVRVGYVSGKYDAVKEADKSAQPAGRFQPYVFCGNWGEPTWHQIIAAWDALADAGVAGFKEYRDAHPDQVRFMNSSGNDGFILCDRASLEMAGFKERQQASARHRRNARIGAGLGDRP